MLRDVSFEADPGEYVGLVGPTGAGKTTLVKLLLRFYDVSGPAGSDGASERRSDGVEAGGVRVHSHDVRDLDVERLREAIGSVSQESYLFYGTVRENIAYGMPDASDEVVREAATRPGAHSFVRELPRGTRPWSASVA